MIQLKGLRKNIKALEKKRVDSKIKAKEEVIKNMKQENIIDLNKARKNFKRDTNDTWDFFEKMGAIVGNEIMDRSYENITDAWKNEPCYIIGAGPGLARFIKQVGFDFLNGKHTIGINHTIEDYDQFEWFLFLDKRFLLKTTYDMKKYNGRIFAHCQTGLLPNDNTVIFHTATGGKPTNNVKDGLYNGNLSGLCALNLALISGANPIYMIGFGMDTNGDPSAYHYKNTYTGEVKDKKIFDKFVRVQRQYDKFEPYLDRIIHVTNGNDCEELKNKMTIEQFISTHRENKIEIMKRNPRIVHISFSNDVNKHADITRHVINECIGNHFLIDQNSQIPEADLYITEHFLSTDKFINAFPKKHKTINIVHTVHCIPKEGFLKNIALTHAWKKQLENHFVKNISVIHGGIDLKPYVSILPDFENKVFGRMTRWSAAKVHPEWNRIVKEVLEEIPDSKCLIFSHLEQEQKRNTFLHPRMMYDKSCKINMFKGFYLKQLSLYVHMNGSFKETLSFAIIEAMASGLPIIYLTENTGVIEEVTGAAGVRCLTINEVKQNIKLFLLDVDLRKGYSRKAKEQAKRFDKNIMVEKFNQVIIECLKK